MFAHLKFTFLRREVTRRAVGMALSETACYCSELWSSLEAKSRRPRMHGDIDFCHVDVSSYFIIVVLIDQRQSSLNELFTLARLMSLKTYVLYVV